MKSNDSIQIKELLKIEESSPFKEGDLIVWRLPNSVIHRKHGPAIIGDNFSEWLFQGFHHREDGPAVQSENGSQEWYLDGERHREDGPAVILVTGAREYWVRGKPHREDGPAVCFANGTEAWFINGQRMSEAEFKAKTSSNKKD